MSLLLFVGLCLASASAAAAALRCFGVGPMVGCSAIALSFIDFAPLTSEKLEHQDPDKAILTRLAAEPRPSFTRRGHNTD